MAIVETSHDLIPIMECGLFRNRVISLDDGEIYRIDECIREEKIALIKQIFLPQSNQGA